MKLFDFQKKALDDTSNFNRVAYYLDMGMGKTFVGTEKMVLLGAKTNLVICQTSKVKDWIDHIKEHYHYDFVMDLTKKGSIDTFLHFYHEGMNIVGVINYELTFRRKALQELAGFTMLLDESSMIQNDTAKRTKFICKKLNPANVILLSGTPINGKYEQLYSQCKLLGWKISKGLFYQQYIICEYEEINGFPRMIVTGYKNIDRLKDKLKNHGAIFMKMGEAGIELPPVTDIVVNVPVTKEYKRFLKDSIVTVDDVELVASNGMTKLLYARKLCNEYNKHKINAFRDLLESTNDRLIVFYNFTNELYKLEDVCIALNRPTSIVNGEMKDLVCYEEYDNSVTFIQYQAGAMGLNLQKANKTVYFGLPLSSGLFEQSKARTNRIGQDRPCQYYYLLCTGSVEFDIRDTLAMRKDYTDFLFEKRFK